MIFVCRRGEVQQHCTRHFVDFFQTRHIDFFSSKTMCMESYLHRFPLEYKENRVFKSGTQIRSIQSYP